jgi:hypothetical protein
MSKFLKLSNNMINVAHIRRIESYIGEYHIYTTTQHELEGGNTILGGHYLQTNNKDLIIIKESTNKADYNKVTDFINKTD